MGTSSSNKRQENQDHYHIYICKIKLNKKKVSGFLCDIRYLNQEEIVPTIITYKDILLKEFKLIEKNKYIIETYDSFEFSTNLEILFISDNYNIVIFKIPSNITKVFKYQKHNTQTSQPFSFLKIYKNIYGNNENFSDNNDYKFYNLLKIKERILDCGIKYLKNEKDYIFKYYLKNKNKKINIEKGLVFNKNNNLIGITMGNNGYKGIRIDGIITEINKYLENKKKNDNKINDNIINANKISDNNSNLSETKKNEDERNNDTVYIHKNKNNNKKESNRNQSMLILNKKNTSNNKEKFELNKERSKLDSIENNNKNDISNKESQREKDNISKNFNVNINNDENEINIIKFEENNKENNKKNRKENNKKNTNENKKENIIENKKENINENFKVNNKENNKKNNKENINENDKQSDKEINLFFLFKNGKELYLDVKESCSFKQVINQLNEKYLWLKNIEIKEYQFEKRKISEGKSVKENKLKDNSTIDIFEYP